MDSADPQPAILLIGLSVFTAIYAASVDGSGATRLAAFTTGYSATFIAAAVGMVLASIIAMVFIRGTRDELLPDGDTPSLVHAG